MQRVISCRHFIISQPPRLNCYRYYIRTALQIDKKPESERQSHMNHGFFGAKRVKRNGSKGRVKEDCILEDKTGNAIIHPRDDAATTLTTGQSYEIKNLSVKNFNGKSHLRTTTETTFTP